MEHTNLGNGKCSCGKDFSDKPNPNNSVLAHIRKSGPVEHKDLGNGKCSCGKEFETDQALLGHLSGLKKGKGLTELTADERRERFRKTGGASDYSLDFSDRVPDGYVGHVVNDLPGRHEKMLKRGWDFVDETSGKVLGSDNKDIGSRVSTPVDATGNRGYLMIIKEEYYEEDQQKKRDKRDRVDNLIKRGVIPGSSLKHGYIPEDAPMKPD